MKKNDLTKKVKKIAIAITVAKIAYTCFTVAATVYSYIPKYDKLEGIDADVLVDTHAAKQQ